MTNRLVNSRGYPNALQARQLLEDAVNRNGGKTRFARYLGISRRYLNLMLNGERAPVHKSVMRYFCWDAVYEVAPEDDI